MRFLFLSLLLLAPLSARADQAVDELLAAFQTQLESGGDITQLCNSLENAEPKTLNALSTALNKAWPGVRDRYLSALTAAAKQGVTGDRAAASRRVRELRGEFMAVYGLGEAQMKPLLKSKSMPALKELRKLLEPTPDEVIAGASDEVKALRSAATKLARFRDAALDAALSTTPTDSMSSLKASEKEIAASAGDLPRDGLKILEKNRKIAENDGVPADEAKGVEECNRWRLYVGLNALVLDPELCEASRDHSTDMKEKGFFAHESPVPGKKTPWDRAKNFGTTSSGENIYMGSTDPHGANTGWFYSPGHHKNMFNRGHSRIGLGRAGGHWTQMFGR
ncbi:CAP domain-containing protein [Haloferula rosea]|uniref:CAP domain-containing protein n=1 Tax=Haloferula rosea TaxID=490093 RepID=A0A934RH41_9BACT|nr:CAP domain-containing protein [Haloferula rosea]MBK1828225.1 CAP domain-containing protein [Haloferula rosea]